MTIRLDKDKQLNEFRATFDRIPFIISSLEKIKPAYDHERQYLGEAIMMLRILKDITT